MKTTSYLLSGFGIASKCLAAEKTSAANTAKSNIILVMPNDLGYGDNACLGNPIMHTPSVDAFEKECLLFDLSKDPGEKTNVVASQPEVNDRLQQLYDQRWDSTLPLLDNEYLPKVSPDKKHLAIRYDKQLKEPGIRNWAPDKII